MIRFLDLKKMNGSFQPALGKAVQQVVDSGSYIRSHEVASFERAYASYSGSKYCTGVGNGFDALRLIFKGWILSGLMREGDEVIVPANTYIASILAVTENRLKAVFVEPDRETFNIDASLVEQKITPRTRAILVVHLYGRNAFSSSISALARSYGLKIVEDNAQAAGCSYKGSRTGSLGHAAAHSFFPTKNLGALGDGGAVTTDDQELAEMVRTLGNYGSHAKGINSLPGVNSRLDELQAAVLNVKLSALDGSNGVRRGIARHYLDNITNRAIALPAAPDDDLEHVWHLFVIRCEKREALRQFLVDSGIETIVHYPVPPHLQGAYKEMNDLSFPLTEQMHREVLSLPLYPGLDESDVRQIIDAVNAF